MPRRKEKQLEGLPPAARAIEAGRRFRPEAFEFRDPGAVFEKGEGGAAGRFRMTAYTGKPMQHWLWGSVVIDLAGLKLAAQKMPILREHLRDRIVGFSEKVSKDGSVELEGVFSGATDDGQEVEQLLGEGFPWQASVGIDQGSVEFVKEGTEVEVNGQKLRGPGTVFRKSTLREVSFVALGADPKTSAESFAADSDADAVAAFTFDPKEAQMAEKTNADPAPQNPATPPAQGTLAPAVPAPAAAAAAAPPAPAGGQTVTLSAQEIEALVDRKVKVLADTRRTRETKLREFAFPNQEQLLQDLAAGDKPIDECMLELKKDWEKKGGAKLAALQKDPATGVGAGSGKVESLAADEESLVAGGVVDEKKAKEKFAASRDLQHEFGSENGYLAYLKATASGSHRFRIVEGQRSAS